MSRDQTLPRYVIDDLAVLHHLHAQGRGVIHNPADKHMHHASCDAVELMTVGQKKWFFASYPDACAYLDEHQRRWGGQWTPCEHCTPSAARPADPETYPSVVGAGVSLARGPRASGRDASSEDAFEIVGPRDGSRSIDVWSDTYLPFEPRTPQQRDLRQALRRELRGLVARRGEILHAAYAGTVPARADVENLLLYNVDQDGGCFASAAGEGVRFELATRPLRPPPSGRERAYAFRYRTVPESIGLRHWREVRTPARWDGVMLEGRPALADVWLALRRASQRGAVEIAGRGSTPAATFAVRVLVTVPAGVPARSVSLVKPLIDGIVCALQAHGDETTIDAVAQRLAGRLGADAAQLANLLRGGESAVLGVVPRLVVPRGDGVQWAPGDDRCVAGELRIASGTGWGLSGEVVEVAPR